MLTAHGRYATNAKPSGDLGIAVGRLVDAHQRACSALARVAHQHGQECILHATAEQAAAEQQRVELGPPLPVKGYREARDAAVPEAVGDAERDKVVCRVGEHALDVGLRMAPRREVELVGALTELGRPWQRRLRDGLVGLSLLERSLLIL